MADEPNKTEQGRQERVAEKAARAKATQGRRDSADAAQSRSEQRKGRNVDEGSAGRVAGFSAREANAGLTPAGNDTTAGRDDFYSNLSKPQASWASFDSGEMKAGSEMEFKADVPSGGGGGGELYAFKIVDDGGGTVSVTTGTVNTVTATALTPTGKPTQLWLKVTFNTDGEVTAASVQTSSGSTSATQDYRLIATITWDGDLPTIVQGIKGSQSIASCGVTHQWGTLYS
tara:strand:- start:321 stop:1010 length:690 start_codon:yes stop_codon:yes gene_type:complete